MAKSKPRLVDVGDLSWVMSSRNRRLALKELGSDYETPTTLAEKTGMNKPMASKTLRAFGERKIVECVNPKSKKGRLYRLTNKGRNLLGNL